MGQANRPYLLVPAALGVLLVPVVLGVHLGLSALEDLGAQLGRWGLEVQPVLVVLVVLGVQLNPSAPGDQVLQGDRRHQS